MSEQKNKPKETNFKQQTLSGFQPIYTPKMASVVFFISSLLFFAFGLPLYLEAESVIEVSKRYDNICPLYKTCQVTIDIDKEIPEPVFIYYHLSNFYQNHRLYVKSRSYSQLRNSEDVETELDNCKPAKYNRDFEDYLPKKKYQELNLKESDIAIPCGMVARSVFNDTYNFPDYQDSLSFKNIVYESDKEIWINGDREGMWRNISDNLRVWMKISLFSNFRKLWGKIEKDVKKGKLIVKVDNQYDVDAWDGEKRIVLSNSSAFGGKNTALGIIFIVAGSFCMLCALIFVVSGVLYKVKLDEDPRSFKY